MPASAPIAPVIAKRSDGPIYPPSLSAGLSYTGDKRTVDQVLPEGSEQQPWRAEEAEERVALRLSAARTRVALYTIDARNATIAQHRMGLPKCAFCGRHLLTSADVRAHHACNYALHAVVA